MLDPQSLPSNHLQGAGQPAPVTAEMAVPRAVRIVCRAELATLNQMLPVALRGEEIEGVHKTRVTIRRLRTCLKFCKPYFNKSVIKLLREELRLVGRVFGAVRDLDVFQLGFSQYYSDPGFESEIWQPAFGERFQQRREEMLACVESAFFSDLMARLEEFTFPGYGLKTEADLAGLPSSLSGYLVPTLTEQLQGMLQFRMTPDNVPPYVEFHQLRLKAKAHRYTLEFFLSALKPAPAAAIIENMVLLQDHLGILNDCVVAGKLLQLPQNDALSAKVRQALRAFDAHKTVERRTLTVAFSQIWADYLKLEPAKLLAEAAAS